MKFNINGNEVEVEDEALTKAIEEKKPFELKIEDVVIRTNSDEAIFKNNSEKEGESRGIEIGRKNMLKALDIEVEGAHKDEEKSIEALNTFITTKVSTALTDAKIEPDKKVQELKQDKVDLVKSNERIQGEFDAFKLAGVKKDQNQTRLNTLSGFIPDNTLNTKANTLTILQSSIKTDFNEDGIMFGIGEDGKPMKDANTSLLPMKDVVSKFFENNPALLKGASGGADGGDSGGGSGKQTLDEFITEMSKENPPVPPNGEVFITKMKAKQEAGLLEV